MENGKICKKCNKEKLLDRFKRNKEMKSGYESTCKDCNNLVTKNRLKKYKRDGICIWCKSFNDGNKSLCNKCKEKKRIKDKLGDENRKSLGLCKNCPNKVENNKVMCKECGEIANEMHFYRNRAVKKNIVEYLGGKCSDCGLITEFHSVYDCHHLNVKEKDFNIGQLFKKPWDFIRKELNKCILLCSNCHRIRHYLETEKKYECE